ncbi:hypothetical protein RCH10_004498 [Variovorax sp. GrIS 2.14]|uniref:hypothetical protein n=1 Tax=Variovorax sp. GrIS 2.14 TaxID=3071709 RepID=UPI0038F76B01
MQFILRPTALMFLVFLAACAGPKPPPGWPTGEERPINGAALTSPASKAAK